MVGLVRHSRRKRGEADRLYLSLKAPFLDPTLHVRFERRTEASPEGSGRLLRPDICHRQRRAEQEGEQR